MPALIEFSRADPPGSMQHTSCARASCPPAGLQAACEGHASAPVPSAYSEHQACCWLRETSEMQHRCTAAASCRPGAACDRPASAPALSRPTSLLRAREASAAAAASVATPARSMSRMKASIENDGSRLPCELSVPDPARGPPACPPRPLGPHSWGSACPPRLPEPVLGGTLGCAEAVPEAVRAAPADARGLRPCGGGISLAACASAGTQSTQS